MITLEDIRTWVKQKSVDPQIESELLFAIACVESSLNPEAVSKKGAQGLFQFMPITQQDLRERFAYPFNPFCPVCSTIAASIYLAWLFSRFPNDINLVQSPGTGATETQGTSSRGRNQNCRKKQRTS